MLLLSLTFIIASSYLLVKFCLPEFVIVPESVLVKVCLISGLSLGLGSLSLFIFLSAQYYLNWNYKITEILFWLVFLAIFIFLHYRTNRERQELAVKNANIFIAIILAVIFGLYLWQSIGQLTQSPHGAWDAKYVWNLKSRIIFRDPEHWTKIFQVNSWAHPDYPLLLPLSTARVWLISRSENQAVPQAMGITFSLLTVGLLYAALAITKGRNTGILGAALLLSTPLFVNLGASQYLDIPLGFYYLASLLLMFIYFKFSDYKILILLGAFTGLSGWAKNDGLLFIVCLLVSFILFSFFKKREKVLKELFFLFAGLAPVLLIIFAFKMMAPIDGLVGRDALADWGKYIFTAERYSLIFAHFKYYFVNFGNWTKGFWFMLIFLIFALGVSRERVIKSDFQISALLVSLILVGYFFVYLISPYELYFHLNTSLNRLLLQIWPSFIFLYFYSLNEI